MKRIYITLIITIFTVGGLLNSCSLDSSKEKPQETKKKKSIVEESFEKQPNAPASAFNGVEEGELLDEEYASPVE